MGNPERESQASGWPFLFTRRKESFMDESKKIEFGTVDWILYIGALIIFALMLFVSAISLLSGNSHEAAVQFVWVAIAAAVIVSKRRKSKNAKAGKTYKQVRDEAEAKKKSSPEWLP